MSEQLPVVAAVENTEPAKPKKTKKSLLRKITPLMWATVIVPTLVSTVYFGFIASERFTSQSSFVVRSPKGQSSLNGLGAILQGTGFSRAQDDIYTVQEYMQSRSALESLRALMPVREFYETKGDIFSRFNGFGLSGEDEAFYQYYRGKVSVRLDSVSGISSLKVMAFDAEEAQKINAALLKQGEKLINQLNARARQDTIRYAEEAVAVAEEQVKKASQNLTDYRISNGVFDLKAQSEVQMSLVSKLQDELIVIQTQLDQVRAVTPENPQIPGLVAREKSLRKEISQQLRAISGGSEGSLTRQAADYQRVFLENELAEKQLAAAMTSLEGAKAEADRQQLYLEVISLPSKPDLALEPKRVYNIVATLIIGLMVYGIVSLLAASIREHKN
ncbi:capsule biosynthesis protein [Neisseria animalis]|uniref:Capsule biosynthesis protein n=1 Tax=Neisseria animalis TaxID=492 RepID=A0A5P3MV05_NEIAN|nr:capsule biosynthesis protein [Neisseria animalis]QEY24489.1 capsule biosynthesis protein [Neisseria animalis]ROW33148.1 capsule biosynthesis protein [Neisseria animalis]VEE07176.1 capsule export inner-membrane protein CtrB [Neisseria animalis]